MHVPIDSSTNPFYGFCMVWPDRTANLWPITWEVNTLTTKPPLWSHCIRMNALLCCNIWFRRPPDMDHFSPLHHNIHTLSAPGLAISVQCTHMWSLHIRIHQLWECTILVINYVETKIMFSHVIFQPKHSFWYTNLLSRVIFWHFLYRMMTEDYEFWGHYAT